MKEYSEEVLKEIKERFLKLDMATQRGAVLYIARDDEDLAAYLKLVMQIYAGDFPEVVAP